MADKARILIVDDDVNVSVTLQAVLEEEGYDVATADGNGAARKTIASSEFDAAIIDLRLNDGNGMDLLGVLKERQPYCAPVMLTGYASLESAISAIRFGVYDYLVKPCDLNDLRASIRNALQRSSILRNLDIRARRIVDGKGRNLVAEFGANIEQVSEEGMIVSDPQGEVVHANEAAARLLAFGSAAEVIATPANALLTRVQVVDESGAAPGRDLPTLLATVPKEPVRTVVRLWIPKTGEERAVEFQIVPILDRQKGLGFSVCTLTDATARVRGATALRVLAESGDAVAGVLEEDVAIRRFADSLVPSLADWCAVITSDGSAGAEVTVAHRDPARRAAVERILARFAVGARVGPEAFANLVWPARPEIYPSVSDGMLRSWTISDEDHAAWQEAGCQSLVSVPLTLRGVAAGSLILAIASARRRFDLNDVTLAQELARRCATAIETARLHASEQEARLRAERAERIRTAQYSANKILSEAVDLESAAPVLLGSLASLFQSDFAALWLTDTPATDLKTVHVWHRLQDAVPGGVRGTPVGRDAFPEQTLKERRVHRVDGPKAANPLLHAGLHIAADMQDAVYFSIPGHSGTAGVIGLFARARDDRSQEELESIAAIGSEIAYFIERKRFEEVVRELSTPVLPVAERLLLVPLIGALDAERATQLTTRLLEAIRQNRARAVVVDLTGVVAIDSHVANRLVKAVDAARLLGAHVIVSGLSPEVCQTLVRLQVDLEKLNTTGDLRGGIEEAQRILGEVTATPVPEKPSRVLDRPPLLTRLSAPRVEPRPAALPPQNA
ncbi:MAG: response regulator [Chloroflexi bacterium]|nr:response regulator [Chloroflexota bacterium]